MIVSKKLFCLPFFLILAGCGLRSDLAPVSELSVYAKSKKTHTVRRGETLYAIAFHHDADYRQLAQLNHLLPPYSLRIGQILNLQGLTRKRWLVQKSQSFRPARSLVPVKRKLIYSPLYKRSNHPAWYWPVRGQVKTSFFPNQGKKGIDIASKPGEKVHASSEGVVAFAGNGLEGYGNLIIIKHNNEYLTAYGNNSKNLVKEGQRVRAGQVIAEIGVVDHRFWGVHFEIRKAGYPVNPILYLQKS